MKLLVEIDKSYNPGQDIKRLDELIRPCANAYKELYADQCEKLLTGERVKFSVCQGCADSLKWSLI